MQHSIVIPSDSHSGINYPPFANANGFETTDCLECLQILDILIYGRRVCFRIWSSRTENVLHAPPLCSFRILTFFTKEYLALPLQPHEPWLIPSRIPKEFADSRQSLRPFPFLSRTEKFFIPLVYATLEFLPLYTTLKNQTFHFYEKSGSLLILVQMSETCTLWPHSSNLNPVFSALLQHFQTELAFVVAFFGGFFIEGSCFFHIFRQSAKAFFVEVA